MLQKTNQVFESDPKTNGVRYMWELLGKLKYADTAGIDINDHINSSIYKEALDELRSEYPNNKNFKMFEERYKKYNN